MEESKKYDKRESVGKFPYWTLFVVSYFIKVKYTMTFVLLHLFSVFVCK